MNRKFLTTVVVTAIALATQANAGFVDITGGYNVLTFGDFTSYNDQTWGSLAASGNVIIKDGYSIGTQWANTGNYPENVLVAGGNVELTGDWGGSVWGGISAGGTVTKTTQYTIKGAIKQSADINSIFDFNDAKVQLDAFSEQLAANYGTEVWRDQSGVLNFYDVADEDVIFYTVDAKDLEQVTSLYFENLDKQYVINVDGYGSDIVLNHIDKKNYNTGDTLTGSNILFNIRNASSLSLGSFYGNILAADIDVKSDDGQMYGTLVAKSFTGKLQFHQVNPDEFEPPIQPPSNVPESSTTTMLVAGAIFLLLLSRKNALVRK